MVAVTRAAPHCRMAAPGHDHFSVSTLSEVYVEDRRREGFFLYIFVGITCGTGHRTCNHRYDGTGFIGQLFRGETRDRPKRSSFQTSTASNFHWPASAINRLRPSLKWMDGSFARHNVEPPVFLEVEYTQGCFCAAPCGMIVSGAG